MRLIAIQLITAILAIPLSAIAGNDQCSNIPSIQEHSQLGCECKSGLPSPIKAPKGMSLIAVCGYKKVEFVGTIGEFFFKGKSTVNGEVRRTNSPTIGDSIWLEANGSPNLSAALQTLKFGNDPDTIMKFKIPPLSEASPCWAADAVVNVTLLNVHVGYESDEDGSYPKGFEVVKVGEYKPCQAEGSEEGDESQDTE